MHPFPPFVVPPALAPGDRVAVVAPAGPVTADDLRRGVERLSEHFEVVRGSALLERNGFLAGSDDERLADLVDALSDPSIKAVIAARGGYGTTRLLDRLDGSWVAATPKWIVGCSDLTALLIAACARARLATIHGPMAAGLWRTDPSDVAELFELLGTCNAPARHQPLAPVVSGVATGPFVGGNLTVLAHLVGTVAPDFLRGAILFIEDVGEAPYRLDRCWTQLRRAGWLSEVAGVVVGDLWGCDTDDRYPVSALDALVTQLRNLSVPSATGFPAAHGQRNRPFVHGGSATLEVDEHAAGLTF